MGHLIANHGLAILSLLGLMPSWVRLEVEYSRDAKYMIHFSKCYFKETKFQTNTRMLQIMATMKRALEIETERDNIPDRVVENVLCKTYRMEIGNYSKYSEILLPGQLLFCDGVHEDDFLQVIYPPGSPPGWAPQRVLGPSLINQWPCGNKFISTSKFIERFGINTTQISTAPQFLGDKLPNEMLHQGILKGSSVRIPLPDCFATNCGITIDGKRLLQGFMMDGKKQYEGRVVAHQHGNKMGRIPKRTRNVSSNWGG